MAVKGNPGSAVGQGLACVKGYNSVQALAGKDRIRQAMIRRDGRLVGVPIQEAYDLVAGQIQQAIRQHGKDSVALYGSAQWSVADAYVASKLFGGALGTRNVDTSARLYAGSLMAGLHASFGMDGSIGCYEDIDHADTFVLWDINLAETDPVLFSRMLARKRANPAVRIVALSTCTARTDYAVDQSLLLAPHSSLAVANAICQELVARKSVNQEFLDRYVAFKRGTTGLGSGAADGALVEDTPVDATWKEYVAFLADYQPERVQALSGLSAANIRWLASLYADPQRRVMTVWGRNVNQDVRGTWNNNALYNIHLLVGKIAGPGNGPLGTTGQPSIGGVSSGAASQPTAPMLSIFRQLERGEIRLLWIQATDPMVSLPNLDRYRRAAAKTGAFLVVSEAYPTPTTDVADVVLPAAMWLEREGVYINVERRAQYFPQVVAPPGDASSDAGHMIEVGRRLGFATLLPYQPGTQTAQVWDEYRRSQEGTPMALPPLASLKEKPGVQWPYANGQETRWRYATRDDPAADASLGAFDFYGHADHRAWIWLRPAEPPAEAPDDAYPFWLTTGAVLEQWGAGSMTQRIPALHRAMPHAYVEINREDAQALGIRDRERVRLVSRRAALEIEARIDYRSQPPRGLLFAPVFDEAEPVNRLMLDAFDPLSGQPDGSKCAVRLERLVPRATP